MAATAPQAEPISTPNITPLIDVLLVLLIMMILTIPAMTHKVAIDLPAGPGLTTQGTKHQLDIAASGALTLDGAATTELALAAQLAPIAADEKADLTLNTDAAAPYGTVERVLATIKHQGVTRLGFAGHERFAGAF